MGSLNDPDTALRFDAPQTRNIVNTFHITVQSQAFMGDKADAREFALMIGSELKDVEGLSV